MDPISSHISIEEQPSGPSASSNSRDWCAIVSTFVVSSALCLIGLSLLLQGDATTGLVLAFASGGILVLTVCAGMGKFRANNAKQVHPEITEDRPPSYRASWRRSFMRRVRYREQEVEKGTGEAPQRIYGTTQPDLAFHLAPDHPAAHSTSLAPTLESDQTALSQSTNNLHTSPEEGSAGISSYPRHTQSLSNILDPPSYHDALSTMDETAKRKLKSECCLPSTSS